MIHPQLRLGIPCYDLSFIAKLGLGHLAADVLGVAFGLELGRVHADDDQLVLVLLLELGQVGEDVVAVDAAEGPEIQQHDLPFEVGDLDRLIGVEPRDAAVEVRSLPDLGLTLRIAGRRTRRKRDTSSPVR